MRIALLALLGALACGWRCAAPDPASLSPPAPIDPLGTATRLVPTRGGSYWVALTPDPEVLPVHDLFRLHIKVYEEESRTRPAERVTLRVSADMPAHGHGMNTRPEVAAEPDGGWLVEGMLFHMLGFWEIYVDVERGGVTERAVFPEDVLP